MKVVLINEEKDLCGCFYYITLIVNIAAFARRQPVFASARCGRLNNADGAEACSAGNLHILHVLTIARRDPVIPQNDVPRNYRVIRELRLVSSSASGSHETASTLFTQSS